MPPPPLGDSPNTCIACIGTPSLRLPCNTTPNLQKHHLSQIYERALLTDSQFNGDHLPQVRSLVASGDWDRLHPTPPDIPCETTRRFSFICTSILDMAPHQSHTERGHFTHDEVLLSIPASKEITHQGDLLTWTAVDDVIISST